jgi:hypothetical protein
VDVDADLHRVREGLLHDPVRRHVETGGQRPRRAVDLQLHHQPGLADVLDEVG